jgi:tRNA (cytidine/uridine-2'-O-)-methyltransferase
LRLCLFQPDNPYNVGSVIRLVACFELPLVIIRPAGFAMTEKALRKTALDYQARAEISQADSFAAFDQDRRIKGRRLILLTTRTSACLYDFAFADNDDLLFGQESSGVPEAVHQAADHRLTIPIAARSLNLALSVAITAAEARRQTGWRPGTAV